MSLDRRTWIRNSGLTAIGLAFGSRINGQSLVESKTRIDRYPELKYINLAGNENPFGPSQRVSLAIMREVPNSSRYPFREEVILKERIAEREGVLPENIVLGNGCDEILSLAGDVYGNPGATIVATRPTYLQLMHYAEKNGAHVDWIDHTSSMQHDLDGMLESIEANHSSISLAYVCNPDTPTGTMLSAKDIEQFCRNASERCTVFLDEVYWDLIDEYQSNTQVKLVREGLPIIIGRSFSKMHGLAGHRVGYAIARKDIAERLEDRKMTSLGYLGVIAATASLDDVSFHSKSVALIRKGREDYCDLLNELGLQYTPSVGNFVFHHTGIEIRDFQARMKSKGFLVGRPFPPYEDWCRISIGNQSEMSQFEQALRSEYS